MWDILEARNVMRLVEDTQDIRQAPGNYTWLSRINLVPALDEEVMGSYEGRVVTADILAEDAKAIVRAAPGFELKSTKIPKLKHGELVNEKQLNVLRRIEANQGSNRDFGIFGNYLGDRVVALVGGVWSRMEALIAAMLLDTFTYDAHGIKITGGTWGMPSDLKVTVAVTWTVANAATAKPVTDILTIKRIAQQKYGINLDRISLSTAVLLNLPSINEFRDHATLFMQLNLPGSGFNAQDVQGTATMFGRMIGMNVEVNDAQLWTEDESAAQTATRYFPDANVILSATAFDNDNSVWDFANAVVNETIPGIVPNLIGSFGDIGGEREGPVGYVTAADPNGNPPGMIMWGAGAGFPRKHKKAANAVLTVL